MTNPNQAQDTKEPRDWLIWSDKWAAWYRDNSAGYTDKFENAGLYTEAEAKARVERGITRAIRVADMVEKIIREARHHEEATARLRSRFPSIHPTPTVFDKPFQQRVQPWMMACFGAEISADQVERGDRLLEETFELMQSKGYDPGRILAIRDYVWSRPIGDPSQEVGGVMVTLAAFCLAAGLDMHAAAETELARIWTKVEKIRAKQAAKPTGSALPMVADPTGAMIAEITTLKAENERLRDAVIKAGRVLSQYEDEGDE